MNHITHNYYQLITFINNTTAGSVTHLYMAQITDRKIDNATDYK